MSLIETVKCVFFGLLPLQSVYSAGFCFKCWFGSWWTSCWVTWRSKCITLATLPFRGNHSSAKSSSSAALRHFLSDWQQVVSSSIVSKPHNAPWAHQSLSIPSSYVLLANMETIHQVFLDLSWSKVKQAWLRTRAGKLQPRVHDRACVSSQLVTVDFFFFFPPEKELFLRVTSTGRQ